MGHWWCLADPVKAIVCKPVVKISGNLHWTVAGGLTDVSFLSECGLWDREGGDEGMRRGDIERWILLPMMAEWFRDMNGPNHQTDGTDAFSVPGKWTMPGLWGKSLSLCIEYFGIHTFRVCSVFLHGFLLPIFSLTLEIESSVILTSHA